MEIDQVFVSMVLPNATHYGFTVDEVSASDQTMESSAFLIDAIKDIILPNIMTRFNPG